MKTGVKIAVVTGSGALVWGLSYCGTLFTTYALVFSSVAAAVASACAIATGFSGSSSS
jgi:hypothetical protein